MAKAFSTITASTQLVATTKPATLLGARVIGHTDVRYISFRTGGPTGTVLLTSRIPEHVNGTSRFAGFDILPPGIVLDFPEGIHVYITTDNIGDGGYPTAISDNSVTATIAYVARQV